MGSHCCAARGGHLALRYYSLQQLVVTSADIQQQPHHPHACGISATSLPRSRSSSVTPKKPRCPGLLAHVPRATQFRPASVRSDESASLSKANLYTSHSLTTLSGRGGRRGGGGAVLCRLVTESPIIEMQAVAASVAA
jgi:hypothetical protein